jgi:hypothetical protein
MTLFVDVQRVPSAILELVKARIMANRKRNRDNAVAAQPLKTPRRRYYNPQAADRRTEPGAVQQGGMGMLIVPSSANLAVKVRSAPDQLFTSKGIQGIIEAPTTDFSYPYSGKPWEVSVARWDYWYNPPLSEANTSRFFASPPASAPFYNGGYRGLGAFAGILQQNLVNESYVPNSGDEAGFENRFLPYDVQDSGNVSGTTISATVSQSSSRTYPLIFNTVILSIRDQGDFGADGDLIYGRWLIVPLTRIDPGQSVTYTLDIPPDRSTPAVLGANRVDFSVGSGIQTSSALVASDSELASFGSAVASEFRPGSAFSMAKLVGPGLVEGSLATLVSDDRIQSGTDYGEVVSPGILVRTGNAFRRFPSFTFEGYLRRPGGYVETNAFMLIGANRTFANLELRIYGGIQAGSFSNESNGSFSLSEETGFLQLPSALIGFESENFVHFALCKNNAQVTFFFNRYRIFTGTAGSDYYDKLIPFLIGPSYADYPDAGDPYRIRCGDLPVTMIAESSSTPAEKSTEFHGLRFTSRSLYNGTLINPPPTITRLA